MPYQAPPFANRPPHPRQQSYGRRPSDLSYSNGGDFGEGGTNGPVSERGMLPGPPFERGFMPPLNRGGYGQRQEIRRPTTLADRIQDPKDIGGPPRQAGEQWGSGPSLKDRVEQLPGGPTGRPPAIGYPERGGGWAERGQYGRDTDMAGDGEWDNAGRDFIDRRGRGRGERGRGRGDRGQRGRARGGRGYGFSTGAQA
jgi:hypothetical protein